MRYALRNQDKIAAAYSPEYLQQHIIASLDDFFRSVDEDAMADFIRTGSDDPPYPVLSVNDVADDNSMQAFAVIGRTHDVLRLAYLGREKG